MIFTQRSLDSCTLSRVNTVTGVMEDDLMFSMEEVEGSAKRPLVQSSASISRTFSGSDDEDTDSDSHHFIRPILDESSSKDICQYLKNLVNDRQLSNSLPKSSFTYQVSRHSKLCENSGKPRPMLGGFHVAFCWDLHCSVRTAVCLKR